MPLKQSTVGRERIEDTLSAPWKNSLVKRISDVQ
jgi:hypothetical protein